MSVSLSLDVLLCCLLCDESWVNKTISYVPEMSSTTADIAKLDNVAEQL